MSGTHVYYNGILMRDCETIEFSNMVEYDETQTHEKYIRTKITVASTLISLYTQGMSVPIAAADQHPSMIQLSPLASDETTIARAEEILQRMQEPRKDFWYAVTGVGDYLGLGADTATPKENNTGGSRYRIILVATGIVPTGSGDSFVQMFNTNLTVKRVNVLDANNGPKPSGVEFKAVYTGNVMRLQATFEICRVLSKPVPGETNTDPGYDAQKARGVISNTWSVTDSLDDDGAVTHTITGKMVVKDQRFKANAMRLYAFPLAFPYARVVSRQHLVDETGLVLQYTYVMKHAGAAPPEGVRKYEASYSESVQSSNEIVAGIHSAMMNIKVMGWYHRSDDDPVMIIREKQQKQMLLRAAYTILYSRIRGIDKFWDPIPGQRAKNTQLNKAVVLEHVGKPQLELQIEVIYTNQDKTEFPNRMINLGNPIDIEDYDPRWWPVDNEWGRLPAKDNENPNFRASAFPYFASGDPTQSDYFTGYFQPPGNNRHTLPRLTTNTQKYSEGTDSKEWAKPGGSVPSSAEAADGSSPFATTNPLIGRAFSAIPSRNLAGAVVLGAADPATNVSYSGISDVQNSGFMYIRWTSEVLHDTDDGVIMVPLSKPRDVPEAKLLGYIPDGTGISTRTGKESAIALRLHAPLSKRVYSVSATRIGKNPQLPEPAKQIVRISSQSTGSSAKIDCVETLLRKELITETPRLLADECARSFTIDARYTYGLSNPWRGSSSEGGDDFEELPVGKSPIDRATSANNAIVVKGLSTGTSPTLSPLFDSQSQYG